MSKMIGRGSARLGRILWGAVAAPFWLGSTLPPPALPARRESALAGERVPLILRQLDGLRETIWRQRRAILALRALWLALLAIDLWLGLRVLAGREVSPRPFLIVAGLILAWGALLIATARPSRALMARTLDRSFGLRERMTTALEASQAGRPLGLRALQILDATRVARRVGTASAFRPHLPMREIGAAVVSGICCVVLLLMLLLQHFGAPDASTTTAGEPHPGAASSQQTEAHPGGQSENKPGGQQGDSPSQNGQQGQHGQAGADQQGQQNENGSTGVNSGSGGAGQLPSGQQQMPNASPSSLLGADGKPIELPRGDPNGQQITTQDPTGRGNGQIDQSAAGASGGSVQQGTVGEAGVDTNQVPYDQRGAVERYFTPSGDEGR